MKALFGILLLFLSGCSMMQPNKQVLKIACTQSDVVVTVNGDRFLCPSNVEVRRDSKVLLTAQKTGFEPYSKTIDYHLSSAAKWDLVGTACWFFPVFGLMSPGAWELDQTELTVQLYPLAKN